MTHEINPKVKQMIEKANIYYPNGLLYLLSIYFNIRESVIPDIIKTQVAALKIVERDYEKGTVKWNMNLFATGNARAEATIDNWSWVEGYRKLFKDVRKDGAGDKASCLSKMKSFFAQHPQITPKDVLKAAQLYLNDFHLGKQDPTYMQRADYFISKQIKAKNGTSTQSRLLQYLELITDHSPAHMRQMKKLKK